MVDGETDPVTDGETVDRDDTDTGAGSPKRPSRRRMAVAAAVCLALAAGGAVCVASNQPAPAAKAERKAGTKKKSNKAKEAATAAASIKVTAEGISEGTSPVITHWTGKSGDAEGLEFYHATEAASAPVGTDAVDVSQGSWEVEVLPSVNSDGSINEGTVEAASVEVSKDSSPALEQAVTTTPADQVTQERLDEVMDRVAEAVSKGDSTLTGEAGSKVVDKVAENAAKNPNADASKIEQKRDDAASTAEQAKPQETAKPAESTGSGSGSSQQQSATSKSDSNKGQSSQKADAGKGNSGSGSTSGGSSQSGAKAECNHNWVAVTKTVHHDAVTHVVPAEYKTVSHPAECDYRYFCNTCNADVTTDPWGHLDATDHESWREEYVVVKAAWDETVMVHDQYTQTDKAAWDETVTTGYRCSKCGAAK